MEVHALNAASRAAALRYGFTYEGTFRQHLITKGRNRDNAWFSMLDSEWPARKAAKCWLAPAILPRRKAKGEPARAKWLRVAPAPDQP